MAAWLRNRWSLAWATLTAAFALHVLDEATHDFLSWYNPSAFRIREVLGGLPLAVSAAGGWLAPGVLSSPPLLAAALWLMVETTRASQSGPTRSTP